MAFVHKGRSLGVYGRLIDLGGYRGLYVKVWEFHLDLPTIGFVFCMILIAITFTE